MVCHCHTGGRGSEKVVEEPGAGRGVVLGGLSVHTDLWYCTMIVRVCNGKSTSVVIYAISASLHAATTLANYGITVV